MALTPQRDTIARTSCLLAIVASVPACPLGWCLVSSAVEWPRAGGLKLTRFFAPLSKKKNHDSAFFHASQDCTAAAAALSTQGATAQPCRQGKRSRSENVSIGNERSRSSRQLHINTRAHLKKQPHPSTPPHLPLKGERREQREGERRGGTRKRSRSGVGAGLHLVKGASARSALGDALRPWRTGLRVQGLGFRHDAARGHHPAGGAVRKPDRHRVLEAAVRGARHQQGRHLGGVRGQRQRGRPQGCFLLPGGSPNPRPQTLNPEP